MSPPGPLFVVGSGPMVGSHVARLFATHNFTRIALFSRSASNLERDASFVTDAVSSASVHTYPTDVTDQATFTAALEKAVTEVGAPEVVVFNAVRINRMLKIGEYSPEDIVEDFKIPNLGLYTTAAVMLPHLRALAKSNPDAHPALFVTSGAVIHRPLAKLFSLSMAKSAQATLARILADENKDIVHVALVPVGGTVSFEEQLLNPMNIAPKFWELYEQKKGHWEFENRIGC